jgi:hypothetical protein
VVKSLHLPQVIVMMSDDVTIMEELLLLPYRYAYAMTPCMVGSGNNE